jgi:hypothetical protein
MGKCILAGHPPADSTKVKHGTVTATAYNQAYSVDLGFFPDLLITSSSGQVYGFGSALFIDASDEKNVEHSCGGNSSWIVKKTDKGFSLQAWSGFTLPRTFAYTAIGT